MLLEPWGVEEETNGVFEEKVVEKNEESRSKKQAEEGFVVGRESELGEEGGGEGKEEGRKRCRRRRNFIRK